MPERILRKTSPHKQRRSRRPFAVSCLLLALVAGAVCGYAALKPLPKLQVTTQPIAVAASQAQPITWPGYGQSAVATDTSAILATNGQQTPLATASLAKIMTALAVLQRKPLQPGQAGPNLTLTQADVDNYNAYASQDGSVVFVQDGEVLTEYQALQALLLPSANNIADSLADWAFGSVDAYLAYANDYASKQGWDTLHFADASGFNSATVGSATDLTKLAQQAIANPVIASIVSQNSAEIPVAGTVYNVNTILGDGGVIGIKTGNNDADLGAFMFAAKQTVGGQPLTLVGAVMGAANLRSALLDTLPVISSTAANFKPVTLATAGRIVGSVTTPWQSATIIATKPLAGLTWNGQAQSANIKLQPLRLPLKKGDLAGTLSMHDATGKTSFVELRIAHDIPNPSFGWRLRHVFSE